MKKKKKKKKKTEDEIWYSNAEKEIDALGIKYRD